MYKYKIRFYNTFGVIALKLYYVFIVERRFVLVTHLCSVAIVVFTYKTRKIRTRVHS